MIGHNSRCNQTVFRSNPDHGYTKISNSMAQDSRLSYDTRGLLVELLSRPDDWEITVASIVKKGGAGRDKVYRMFKELHDLGYADVEQDRHGSGKFDRQRYRVTDDPSLLIERAAREIDAVLPFPEKPETVVPFPEKPEAVKRAKMAETSRFAPLTEKPETDGPLTGSPLTGLPLTDNPQQTNKKKELINKKEPPIVPQTGDVSALNNETWGSTPWRVAAGVTVAVGMAFGATPDPAFASADSGPAYVQQNLFAADVERAAHVNANDRMLTELATLTAGADRVPFRYNVPWSTVSTVHEAREAATEGGPLKKKKEKTAPGEYTHDFEEFWKIYPRREGKGLAFKSWQKLTIERKRIAYVALRKQLLVLNERASDSQGNFCPLPATWINQCRFDDDVGGDAVIKRPAYSNNGSYAGKTI